MRAVEREAEGQLLSGADEAGAVEFRLHLLPGDAGVDQAFHAQRFGQIDGQGKLSAGAVLAQAVADRGYVIGPDAEDDRLPSRAPGLPGAGGSGDGGAVGQRTAPPVSCRAACSSGASR